MFDFSFLKKHHERIMICKDLPLPVIMCDKFLNILWYNDQAKLLCSHLTDTEGLRRALLEFDFDRLLSEALENGGCIIQEIIPLSSMGLKITPLMEDGAPVGAVLILLRSDSLIDARSIYRSTNLSGAISDSIRDVVSEIFSILDQTAIKSDLLNMGWIKPGLNGLACNSYRILRIASNITEYARYQSELLNFRPGPVNLSAFLRESQDSIAHLAGSAGIPLRFSIPKQDIFVRLDLERFEHAFFNILHNCLYFTRPGNHILITMRPNNAKGSVAISVTDKGLGIPKHILPEILRPYYAYPHNKAARTVGLGLAIANLAIQAHEGSLDIRSGENEGTSVRIVLPLDNDAARGATLAQNPDSFRFKDRFSIAYVGLADVPLSPYLSL